MNIYYDSEFTGLHQTSTLISIALVADDGREFYAEFSDYDASQCDEWLKNNVLAHTLWLQDKDAPKGVWHENRLTLCYGESHSVRNALTEWLAPYKQIEIWADCLAWDWVLFCQLYGGAQQIPQQIFYMPFDLVTLFKAKGLNPDTDREAYAQRPAEGVKLQKRHNALCDARLVQSCYQKLIQELEG